MHYSFKDISKILTGHILSNYDPEMLLSNIVYDSRNISYPKQSLFIALQNVKDGHDFVADAYKKGIRNFLVSKDINLPSDTNILKVEDVLAALQSMAKQHRLNASLQSIAITGSNGKTIVKEWLSQVLSTSHHLVKSPKSYNSQIGVPLSVLLIDNEHEIGVFEAGISKTDEMLKLSNMIMPDIGILTNIGDAHDKGFENHKTKLAEKSILFENAISLIYNTDDALIREYFELKFSHKNLIGWGKHPSSKIKILDKEILSDSSKIKLMYGTDIHTFDLPFTDRASIENIMHVITTALYLEIDIKKIAKASSQLSLLPLRMETKQGRNNSLLINDSYSADLSSLQIGLEYLDHKAGEREKIIIISDFMQQANDDNVYKKIAENIEEKSITRIVAIGNKIKGIKEKLNPHVSFDSYENTTHFIDRISDFKFDNAAILLKGAHEFHFHRIFDILSSQVHQTVLEINLTNIGENIRLYRSMLKASTKMMAVIKASAYGTGSADLAAYLKLQSLDYLAVALADEGVELRKQGIQTPILVFNLQETATSLLWEYDLEPEVFSLKQLKNLAKISNTNGPINIHLKIDSGMRRLGFMEDELDAMVAVVTKAKHLHVASIFSHLASSENENDDAFTLSQINYFEKVYTKIENAIGYKPIKHILNSSGIERLSKYQFDMVRLGLGMYGIGSHPELKKVHTLKSRILQIKKIKAGEATGYGRHAIAKEDGKIAIIGLGYADGLIRKAGNRNFSFLIKQKMAPIIGNVCMDLTICDVSDIEDLNEGEEVIVFGENHDIRKLAKACDSIPYEIMSRISKRVKRIYIED